MDALAHGVPQVIVPGRVFERIFNAESVERAGAGVKIDSFNAGELSAACQRVIGDPSIAKSSLELCQSLSSLGGPIRIVSVVEKALGA